jgi:hypothetical protein
MNYQRRASDKEFDLEESYVTNRFCDERDRAMRERMEKNEDSVKSLREGFQKLAIQLGTILGGITLLGIIANLLLQYLAINHGVKP